MSVDAPILVVEDETDLRSLIDINLRREGFQTLLASNAAEAIAHIDAKQPRALLLDLMLPDMPGTELCRLVRARPEMAEVPIIIVSARDEEIDRVVGFEVGADDYVVKSNLSMRELMLRLRAVLRRCEAPSLQFPSSSRVSQVVGCLKLDTSAHRVWVEGAEVLLTATEFKLLRILLESVDRVQTRGSLLERVWDMPADLMTRTVDTHVKRLREKIGPASEYIQTVRGVGYRFHKP